MMNSRTRGIRFSDAEWTLLKKTAQRKDISVTQLVRDCVSESIPSFKKLQPQKCYVCGRELPQDERYWQHMGDLVICNECAKRIAEVNLSKMRGSN